jgi:cytochrome P450
MLQDTEMWNDPENFRPERHLDADGKLFRNEAFIPFGIGNNFETQTILPTRIILMLF